MTRLSSSYPEITASVVGLRSMCCCEGWEGLTPFRATTSGAQNNLQRLFHLADKPTYDRIRQLTWPWHPYEGVVYFHLLLDKLRANGAL